MDRIERQPRARRHVLKAIRGAADHGLDPKWYGLAEAEKAGGGGRRSRDRDTPEAAFVAYASDLSTGRVRANRVDKDIDIIKRKASGADLLKAAAGSPATSPLAR